MNPRPLRIRRLRFSLSATVLFGLLVGSAAAQAAAPAAPVGGKAALAEIDRLAEKEQKVQQAYDKAVELIAQARRTQDEPLLTRALVKAVELRTGLAGFETAVRFLREEAWPKAPAERAVLDLYYGAALVNYFQAYRWEIQSRERTIGTETVDLKAWTRDQIATEAIAAYARAWGARESWGIRKIADWSDFLSPNDYPASIRGTLRDAVSYLFAELLADSSLWSPAQSNGAWRLDRKELLAEAPKPAVLAALADPAIHPLVKMTTVLADLEEWHRTAGRPAAELEARLERLRRLYGNLDSKADRALLRDDLAARLPRYRAVSWWAMGMATLADWTRNQDATDRPQALVEAREITLAGVAAYPESAGGSACRRIAREIEAPNVSLQAMASDGPGRRSIRVVHANLSALYFRAYRLDVEGWIAHGGEMPLSDVTDPFSAFLGQKTAMAWQVDLPATPDFRSHVTYVTPPLAEPGAYAILASAREDFRLSGNRRLGVRMVIGDLVLANRGIENGQLTVLALDGETGRAVSGVEVRLYRRSYEDKDSLVETMTSSADGIVRFREPANDEAEGDAGLSRHFYLFGRRAASFAFDDLGWVQAPETNHENASTLLYTDRAIYRPGQKIYWKALAWRGEKDDGDLHLEPGVELKITLEDPNGQEAASTTVTTNEYGTAAAEFIIPTGRPLGAWSLKAAVGNEPRGNVSVQVEEYKRPTFEVTLDAPAEALRLNRPASFRGKALYLFGLPVTGATVRWQVTREPVYPWWWGFWGFGPRDGASERIASGEAPLGADGGFIATFTPEADESASHEISYRFVVSAEVTDEGGETREAERAYRVGFAAVEAQIDSNPGFLTANEPAQLGISRTDLDGAPRSGRGTWRLVELRQPDRPLLPSEEPIRPAPGTAKIEGGAGYATPGDALRPRWETAGGPDRAMFGWEAGAEVARGEAQHGADGRAEIDLPLLQAGAYRLIYSTEDEYGQRAETQRELIVAAGADDRESGGRLALPALLLANRQTARVGETAHLLVHSGFPGQEMFLETWQSGRLRERRRLVAGESPLQIDLNLRTADRGGLLFRLFVLRDHQAIEQDATITVPWDDKQVEIELSSFRDKIRPGDHETWRVTVREPRGVGKGDDSRAPVAAAELLASMYDQSLDAFAEYHPPAPLDLFPNRALASFDTSTSLGSNTGWQLSDRGFVVLPEVRSFRPDELRGLSAYGLGGPGVRGGKMLRMAAMAEAAPAPQASAQDLRVSEVPKLAALGYLDSSPPPPPPPPPGKGAPQPAQAPVSPRTNFVETAFWQPHLLTGADGSAAIEFTVPDSLTSWSVWVHALTRDFRSGSIERETRSAKELMVRPYLPRFLREGDRAEIRAVVNFAGEAGETPLEGDVRFELQDAATEASLLADFGLTPEQAVQRFTVEPGGGATVVFPITVPKRIGEVAFQLTARAGRLSDGERRALPVLPSRLHLAQSRFAALRGNETRTLAFEELASSENDPTRVSEQMVVTLDAQLFYGVLDALPYLIDYPYECTEQTLNRFLSTGIARSLFDRYPAVGEMAALLAQRETPYEAWSADDPNRRMALEETPWLQISRGGETPGEGDRQLIKVLDPKIAVSQRNASLAKLREAQLPSGAFPWWPGGPPSDYMTVYLLLGFARAGEFGVEVPRDLVERGWRYLGGRYREEWEKELKKKNACCIELLTLLNYVASAYPDPSWMAGALDPADRTRIADRSFVQWRQHSPYMKGLLALTLHRMGRKADAKLIWDSVMDSAKTTRDEGTFWQPEERSWLWYNDTIESHAFALRTLLELQPKDPRLQGLVQWIFLQKKLGHWQSTRATAEVLYSLASYLKQENQLGTREAVNVTVTGVPGGKKRFVFEPDRYTGKHNQLVVPGAAIDAASAASKEGAQVVVTQETPGLMFASATWHFATDQLPATSSGDLFHVERRYFRRVRGGAEVTLEPFAEGTTLHPGDEVEVQLTIRSRAAAEYVHLRDPRAAGFEPGVVHSSYAYDSGLGRYEETRDAATDFFFEWLPAGEYTLKYRLRANVAGTFRVGPATLQSLYAPEFVAYSAGAVVRVVGE